MNIELKPIAESKVRQLGGDVCGVLVRTDDGVMAVSEHGRCTRLDAGVIGPVESACMSDMRDEFEAAMAEIFDINDEAMARVKAMRHVDEEGTECYQGWEDDEAPRTFSTAWLVWKRARAQGGQGAGVVKPGDPLPCPFCGSTDVGGAGGTVGCYRCPAEIAVQNANTAYAVELWNNRVKTQPQPAVPEGWKLVPVEPTEAMMRDAADNLCGQFGVEFVRPKEQFARAVYRELLRFAPATPTTPQADGWVRCDERLPTEEDCWVWIYDIEDSDIFHALWRDLKGDYENGHMNLSHWMPTGLKRPQPPKQEGKGNE